MSNEINLPDAYRSVSFIGSLACLHELFVAHSRCMRSTVVYTSINLRKMIFILEISNLKKVSQT